MLTGIYHKSDIQMDQWKFDLLDFDLKHPVFSQNAAEFMVKVTEEGLELII